ncbi:MAG: DUF4317 domain-containing protein [Lachnospiraceae bacterium]|nr:DUF4317 domain-containing protein [Lachnospiraceae bacterium]
MNKKDVLELKKRYKKESCTINRMAGCYVDGNKEKILKLNEDFLNLKEEEFYKFMEIAKKTISGTIGNNILELEFPLDEEAPGGRQQFLYGLRSDALKNEDLLDRLYDLIIDSYQYVGNYLILVFHDTYDIMTKTSDNNKLDESEEVYEYLLVSVCPVTLSKPGLGYRSDENRIGARIRDWVVGVPDLGFLFPAFDNRSADIHKVDYFVRDAKDSHSEFVTDVLGCGPKKTAAEQRIAFSSIVKRAYGINEEGGEEALVAIQESLNNRIDTGEEMTDKERESILLDGKVIEEVLQENNIEGEPARIIREIVQEEFADELPAVANLIDNKALEANAKEKEKRELVKEVATLKTELAKKTQEYEETITAKEAEEEEEKKYDIVVRVKPSRADKIRSQMIDERKYLIIPLEEDDELNVNGIKTAIR